MENLNTIKHLRRKYMFGLISVAYLDGCFTTFGAQKLPQPSYFKPALMMFSCTETLSSSVQSQLRSS